MGGEAGLAHHLEGGVGGVGVEDEPHRVRHETAGNRGEEAVAPNTHTPIHFAHGQREYRTMGGGRSCQATTLFHFLTVRLIYIYCLLYTSPSPRD